MADVARLAGGSHQTVSRVLNSHPNVKPQTRDSVLAAIAELGYRPNAAARTLVTRRTRTLGVVSFDTTLYGPASMLYGIERAATLGIPLDGSAAAIIELGDLAPMDIGFTEVDRARETLCGQMWEVAVRIRERAERLSELDRVSEHALVDVLRKLEKQHWMLRAQRPD